MKKILPLLLVIFSAPTIAYAQPASPLDGTWRGRSDGGSCNAPLDFVITIESGFVDGSAYDSTAHGPVPNLKTAPPPAPTPGLWQIHGVAKGGSFSLMTVASVRSEDRRSGKLAVTSQGASLVVVEQGGCGRRATLTKGLWRTPECTVQLSS